MNNQAKRQQAFLTQVLGPDGYRALEKACAGSPELAEVLIPRTILSWVTMVAETGYDDDLPGFNNGACLTIKKSEKGFAGSYSPDEDARFFNVDSIFQAASFIAVTMGLDLPAAPPSANLAPLGKSIDLLVRARLTTELLAKRLLDPNLGYAFKVTHGMNDVKVHAFTPQGQHVGFATFHHEGPALKPLDVAVDDKHQRKGIASHMYRLAEQSSGKKIAPGNIQTEGGRRLWEGNARTPQFGKTELPGQPAKPMDEGKPLAPDGASRAQKVQKPVKPQTTTLKMSEDRLLAPCRACGGKMALSKAALKPCLCWAEAGELKLEKTEAGFLVTFGARWDQDAREAFISDRLS